MRCPQCEGAISCYRTKSLRDINRRFYYCKRCDKRFLSSEKLIGYYGKGNVYEFTPEKETKEPLYI